MDLTVPAACGFTALGFLAGVQFGRWSLLLGVLWPLRRQYRRQVPRWPVPHAGGYVQPGRYGHGSLDAPDRFRQVR